MKPGDLYLVQFPFSDGTAAKLRPIMIISNEEMNQSEDVVVVPLTSRPNKDDPFTIYVGGMDFAAAGRLGPAQASCSAFGDYFRDFWKLAIISLPPFRKLAIITSASREQTNG